MSLLLRYTIYSCNFESTDRQQATLTTLQEAVKNIPYIGGATVTAAALNQTLEEFKKNDRPNAPNVSNRY